MRFQKIPATCPFISSRKDDPLSKHTKSVTKLANQYKSMGTLSIRVLNNVYEILNEENANVITEI